jgi:hypothetical protein
VKNPSDKTLQFTLSILHPADMQSICWQAVPTAKGQALADEFGIKFFETVSCPVLLAICILSIQHVIQSWPVLLDRPMEKIKVPFTYGASIWQNQQLGGTLYLVFYIDVKLTPWIA